MSAAILLCLVIAIADGDTLTARCETPTGMENIKVRLAEIDAPEKAQAFGARSKQHLAELCFKKAATARPQTTAMGEPSRASSAKAPTPTSSRSAPAWPGSMTST